MYTFHLYSTPHINKSKRPRKNICVVATIILYYFNACSWNIFERVDADLTFIPIFFFTFELALYVCKNLGKKLTPYPRLSENSLNSDDLMLGTDVNLDQADDDVSKDYNASEKTDLFMFDNGLVNKESDRLVIAVNCCPSTVTRHSRSIKIENSFSTIPWKPVLMNRRKTISYHLTVRGKALPGKR